MQERPEQHAVAAALAVASRLLGVRAPAVSRAVAYEVPAPPRPPAARAESRHVAEALPFLAMSLEEFRARGAKLEVRVPWLDVTLWMVPTDRDVAQLTAEGVRRGRIWTAGELMQLMAITDLTPEPVKTVTHAKLELDGEITEVRPRGDGR